MALLGEEVEVIKLGTAFEADPPGSRYCVMDYVNDPHAAAAARTLAFNSSQRQPAFAEALLASLDGEDQTPPLMTYDISPPPPPGGRYIVLNYARHYPSRVAMRIYSLKVRDTDPDLATRLNDELQSTEDEFAEYVRSRIPKKKPRANAKKKGKS